MKNTLLFDTAIGSQNLGDEIIFASAQRGLRPIIQDSSIYRLGTHIENFTPLQMMRPNGKIKFFSDSMDYKFICGTSILISGFMGLHTQFRLNPFNRPLYRDAVLVGVGRSSAYTELGRSAKYLYTSTLSKAYAHSVRDDETKRVLESIGLRAINTGCPTLWELTPEKCAHIPTQKAANVVFSVSGQPKYHDKAADTFMIECLKKNYAKRYAWIQTSADEGYLRSLIDPEAEDIELIYSLEKYASLLDAGDVEYVGTRLHGGIFALQHDRRSLIVSIDQRAEGLHASNNIPIIRRQDISTLPDRINGPIRTEVRLRRSDMESFIEQFV